jgi:two-component system response regulator RstA
MVVESDSRSVRVGGRLIALSSAEFDLLWLLALNAGSIVSREDIYRALRGIEYDGIDRTMDVRIGRLRRKMGDNAREPEIIKNVRGEGYLLTKRA